VNLDPDLYTDAPLFYGSARNRVSRPEAALLTSPAADAQQPSAHPPPVTVMPPPGWAKATVIRRTH
jgi:hypothetical protein